MEQKRTIIDVNVETSAAIRAMAEYEAKIQEVKHQESALKKAIKERGAASKEDREQLAILKEMQKSYASEVRALSKEIQNNITAEQKYKDTLKGLGAALSNAKDKLRSLTIGTEEYAKQEQIVSAMNEKLKEAEASYGVFSRNVGNYPDLEPLNTQLRGITQTLAQMRYEGKDNTEEFRKLSDEAAKMRDAISDTQQQINAGASDTLLFDSLMQSAQSLVGAWTLYNSVIGTSIKADENLAEAVKNLQTGIAALTAMTSIMNSMQKQSALMQGVNIVQSKARIAALKLEGATMSGNIIVQKAATAAQWAFNAAANANPYMLLVTALVAVGGALVLFTSDTKKSREQLAAFNDETARTNEMLKEQNELQNFNIKAMRAAGASEEDVMQQRRTNAQTNLNTQKEALEKLQAMYDSANKKTRKKMQETLDSQKEKYEEYQHELAAIDEEIALHAIRTNKEAEDEQIRTTKEAAEKRIALRKAALNTEQKETRAAEDARIALMTAGENKELEQERVRHERALDQLRNRLETDNNLTIEARKAINEQIEYEIQSHEQKVTAIQAAASKSRNEASLSTIESISSMLQKTTEEQIADVNKLYEEAYAQIEKLRSEQTPPERAGFATDEEYEAAMARYNDFMLNLAVTQTRLEKQQANTVAKIRQDVQDKMDKETADALAKEAAARKAQLDTDLLLADNDARAKYEAKMKYLNAELEAVKGNAEEEVTIQRQMVDAQRELDKSRIESFEKYSAQVISALNTVNDLFNALGDRELEETRDRYNQEQEALQAKLDAGFISQEMYNEKMSELDAELAAEEAKIARQQAIRERALSIFQIILDTAVAVMKTYKDLGPVGGVIASAAVSALGAVQLATVMAEPLPKAARGRYIQGRRHSQGGEVIEAEDGEFIMNRRSVQMFWPELSAMSVAGGGVPFQVQDGGYATRNSVRTQSEAMQDVQLRTVVDELSQQNHEELIRLTRATISAIANLKIYASVEDIRRGDKNYVNIEKRSTL